MDVLRVRLRDPGMEAFLEDARALGDVSRDPGPIANLWEVRYPKRAGVAPRLSALLDKHREAVVMSSRPPSPGPDFRREPRLEPIPSHEAAFILLRERKQHLEALGADKVKAGAFLVHLNEILAGVACFRLTPGFRATRKELVLAAVGKGEPR